MAISRVKVWIAGEVLTASDLNAEFNNILNNAASMISPLGGNLVFTPDATYDIGASGLTRPRNIYFSGTLTGGGASLTSLTHAAGTITTSQPTSLTQTWNAGGVTFTGILMDVTDTASAAASLLADLQVGGTSQWKVSKAGVTTQIGAFNANAAAGGNIISHSSGYGLQVTTANNADQIRLTRTGSSTADFRIYASGNVCRIMDLSGTLGYLELNSTGVFNTECSLTSNYARNLTHTGASPFGMDIEYTGAAPNGTSNNFLYCGDTGGRRFQFSSNGGIYNYQANDVNLSDLDVKPITRPFDSEKIWNFGKKMREAWIQFKYEDQTHDDWNSGVGSQLVKEAAGDDFPELTEYSDWGTKGTPRIRLGVYTHDLMNIMGAVTTEAQFRIESLESTVAKLVEEFNEYRKNHQ